jgi:hypothetical protein
MTAAMTAAKQANILAMPHARLSRQSYGKHFSPNGVNGSLNGVNGYTWVGFY